MALFTLFILTITGNVRRGLRLVYVLHMNMIYWARTENITRINIMLLVRVHTPLLLSANRIAPESFSQPLQNYRDLWLERLLRHALHQVNDHVSQRLFQPRLFQPETLSATTLSAINAFSQRLFQPKTLSARHSFSHDSFSQILFQPMTLSAKDSFSQTLSARTLSATSLSATTLSATTLSAATLTAGDCFSHDFCTQKLFQPEILSATNSFSQSHFQPCIFQPKTLSAKGSFSHNLSAMSPSAATLLAKDSFSQLLATVAAWGGRGEVGVGEGWWGAEATATHSERIFSLFFTADTPSAEC